jgi:hypothetical protein
MTTTERKSLATDLLQVARETAVNYDPEQDPPYDEVLLYAQLIHCAINGFCFYNFDELKRQYHDFQLTQTGELSDFLKKFRPSFLFRPTPGTYIVSSYVWEHLPNIIKKLSEDAEVKISSLDEVDYSDLHTTFAEFSGRKLPQYSSTDGYELPCNSDGSTDRSYLRTLKGTYIDFSGGFTRYSRQ